MVRFYFVIFMSIPFIILLYSRAFLAVKNSDKYSEEKRYKYAVQTVNQLKRNAFIDTDVYGEENLPKDGGYVMFANHQGKYDAVGIIYGHEKPCTIVMDDKRSNLPIMKPFLQLIDGKTLVKGNMKSQAETIVEIVNEVKQGRKYIIFPEGGYATKDKDNTVEEFKAGSFKCATKAKAPVVPVALIDSYKPFGVNSLKRVKTQVHFLQPLYYDEYKEMRPEELAKNVKHRIEDAINENLPTNA